MDSSGDQTTTVQPPGWIRPYVEQGLAGSSTLLQQGGPQQYQGSTVVPFSDQTQQGLGMQANRAMQGSPLVGAAQGATQGIAGGGINQFTAAGGQGLGAMAQGGPNPYLDATFDRAAGAVGRNLDTFFARSGRDLDAQASLRGEAMSGLANQVYGGAYEGDAQRRLAASQGLGQLGGQVTGQQLGAAQLAPTLANQDYLDIAQLRDVGSTVENLAGQYQQDSQRRWDFEQNRPELAMNNFINRVSGQTGNYLQTTSPVYQNRGAGALGGAMLGNQLFPGAGGIIGGGILGSGLLG